MFTHKFISRSGKLTLRITSQRRHGYIGLKVSITPDQLNEGKLSRSLPQYTLINTLIQSWRRKCEDLQIELTKTGGLYFPKDITDILRGREPQGVDFFSFTDRYVKGYTNPHTYEKVTVSLRKLREHKPDLTFTEITPGFLREYETRLLKRNKVNTVAKDLSVIRAMIRAAIKEEVTEYNPFNKGFTITHQQTKKITLTLDEIQAIQAVNLSDQMNHARNVFLFQFYTGGMRIGDTLRLKWENVKGESIVFVQGKTEKKTAVERVVSIVPQARSILDQYKGKGYIFPYMPGDIKTLTARVNMNLKRVARKAGIDKNISTHTARHSFALYADGQGIGLAQISKALGHSDTGTTHTYLRGLREETSKHTLDNLFGQKPTH